MKIILYPVMIRRKVYVTPPSKNDRLSRWVEAAVIKAWREQAHALCLIQADRPRRCSLVRIALTRFLVGVLPDEDNLVTQSKPIVDGIIASGIAPDDSPKHVQRSVQAERVRHRIEQRWEARIVPIKLMRDTMEEHEQKCVVKKNRGCCAMCGVPVTKLIHMGAYTFIDPCGHRLAVVN